MHTEYPNDPTQGCLRKFDRQGEFSDTRSAEGMPYIPIGPCYWDQSDSTFASRNKEDPLSKRRRRAYLTPGTRLTAFSVAKFSKSLQ